MRLSDITDYPRGWDRNRFPFVVQFEISKGRFEDFETRAADQTQIRLLGHDVGDDGEVTVHVGCATEEAGRRIKKWWT
jgi:hypothetical protein